MGMRQDIDQFGLDWDIIGRGATLKDDIIAVLEALQGTRGRIWLDNKRIAPKKAIKLVKDASDGIFELIATADPRTADGEGSVLLHVELARRSR